MCIPLDLNDILASIVASSDQKYPNTTKIINDLCDTHNTIPLGARVATLLFVAATDADLILTSDSRIRAIDLMFTQVTKKYDRLLRNTDIRREQRDVKLEFLVNTFRDANDRFRKSFDQYQGVERLHHFRQSLLNELGRDAVRLAILPLLGSTGDPVEQLRTALSAAVDYRIAEATHSHATLTTAQDTIDRTIGFFHESRNKFAQSIIHFLETLKSDLTKDFDASPYGKPAIMAVSLLPRRYPLHVSELEVAIPLELRNDGQGVATQVEIVMTGAIGLRADPTTRVQLSDVAQGTMLIELPATTEPFEPDQPGLCDLRVWWSNVDTTEGEKIYRNLTLAPQDSDVDLSQIGNPYSSEPVTTQDKLIGRDELLARITRTLDTETVGSVYIYGQKRVGKTSLARVAGEIMGSKGVTVLFVDIGSVKHFDVIPTVNNLTTRLVDEIGSRFYGLSNYTASLTERAAPSLDGSLVLLAHVLDQVTSSNPRDRIVIIIDEFDGLPVPLLRRNEIADTFFLGLRNISAIDRIGLVLVGGERMQLVMNGPGVALNRFVHVSVDFLDRATQWQDFRELVCQPTHGVLEFTDSACVRIYEYTDGNPYYTKQLCEQILHKASVRSDAFIDSREVDSAVEDLLSQIGVTSFSHYWEDLLLEDPNTRDEITLYRRRWLLAFGMCCDSDFRCNIDDLIQRASESFGLDALRVRRELDGFVSRKFFTILSDGATIQSRIRVFGRWIMGKGQEQIVLSAPELEAAGAAIIERQHLRVSLDEAEDLSNNWGPYNRGRRINGERILRYLEQFGDPRDQRLIFQVLKGIRFIGFAEESRVLGEFFRYLEMQMKERYRDWSRNQIRVSYAGPPGKSGLVMARLFAEVNRLVRGRGGIVSPSGLKAAGTRGVKDVVLIEDFVGTGDSLVEYTREFAGFLADDQHLYIFVVSGMSQGIDVVRKSAEQTLGRDRVSMHCMHEIPSDPSPFDSSSNLFSSAEDAADARRITIEIGRRLLRDAPLGYGDCCSLVVFTRGIPNNAPPILWRRSKGNPPFEPLFPRN